MQFFRTLLFAVLATGLLTGCEHWDSTFSQLKHEMRMAGKPKQNTYSNYVATHLDPNVEVFDIQSNSQPVPVNTQTPQPVIIQGPPVGVPSEEDPNVTVFPLQRSAPAPASSLELVPPSQFQRGLQSPFDESSLDQPKNHNGDHLIYFSHGSSHLGKNGQQIVQKVSADYNAGQSSLINVTGHASKRAETSDEKQRQIVNMKMSMKRAMKVTQALIKNGVPAEVIKTSALGDTKPAVALNSLSQEAANRRVVIQVGSATQKPFQMVQLAPSENAQPQARRFPTGGPVTLLPLN